MTVRLLLYTNKTGLADHRVPIAPVRLLRVRLFHPPHGVAPIMKRPGGGRWQAVRRMALRKNSSS